MKEFIVSARRFRPQQFAHVVGQNHVTQTLKNAIARDQLAHAYLFTGPRGVGKTSCARIFARAINCLDPTPDHEACGECESCVAFAKDRSFNIHELDAASNNSVDDIRALTDKVRIAPQVGKYSVYIIDEVHMLSAAAFNAFLKTLEEPPSYAIFILATTEKQKILPTILSRCQVYDFNRIKVEDMVEYLKYVATEQGITFDEESLHIISQKADGALRDALSLFDRVVSFCGNNLVIDQVAESIGSLDFNTYFRAVELTLQEDFKSLLMILDEILRKGFDAQLFITGMCEHLRNLLVAKNPETATLLESTAALNQQYIAQAAETDYDFLFNAMNLLTQTDTTYRTATNRRLHAELALIKLCALKKKESIAEHYPMPSITVESESGDLENKASGGGKTSTEEKNKEKEQSNQIKQSDNKSKRVPDEISSSDNSLDPTPQLDSPKQDESTNPSLEVGETEQTRPASQPKTDLKRDISPSPHSEMEPNITPPKSKQVKTIQPESSSTSPQRRSITGFSLNNSPAKEESPEQTEERVEPPVPNYTPEEAQRLIEEHYPTLIQRWHAKKRPRLASALEIRDFNGTQITVSVPDQVQEDDLNQAKWEIEQDIFEITGGVKSQLMVQVCFVEPAYRPITVEQKYKYLAEKNSKILQLHELLDLTT